MRTAELELELAEETLDAEEEPVVTRRRSGGGRKPMLAVGSLEEDEEEERDWKASLPLEDAELDEA